MSRWRGNGLLLVHLARWQDDARRFIRVDALTARRTALSRAFIVHVCPVCWQRCVSEAAFVHHWGSKHKQRERPAPMLFWQVPREPPPQNEPAQREAGPIVVA